MSAHIKHQLLRLHRWAAIVFILPLLALILTGLVLSFEPALQLAYRGASAADGKTLTDILSRHDPQSMARRINLRGYDRSLEIEMSMGSKSVVVDLDTKELRASTGAIARAFEWSRIVHIRLFWHDGLIVRISTISLIVLMLIGMFVAWPRLGRSLSALHKSVAWIGIPLYAAIAVTGVLMSYNITFGGGGSAPMNIGMPSGMAGAKFTLQQAVQKSLEQREADNIVWVRSMGPRTMMRYLEDGRFQGYFVTPNGAVKTPSNLPRGFHEGLWFGYAGPVLNIAASLGFLFLAGSGLMLWLRRTTRRHNKTPMAQRAF